MTEILRSQRMRGMIVEAHIVHRLHERTLPTVFRQSAGSLQLMVEAQGKRLQSYQIQIAVEGRRATAQVTQLVDTGMGNESSLAESLTEVQAMIAFRRTVQFWELPVAPVETPAVYNDAPDGCAVAVDPLRSRLHNDVGPPFKRIAQIAATAEGIVDNEWYVMAMGYGCDGF